MKLSQYSFEFHHIPRKYNLLADYLSRITVPPAHDLYSHPELLFSNEALPVINNDNDLHQDIHPLITASQANYCNIQSSPNQFVCAIDHSDSADPVLEILDGTIYNEQL